MLTIDELKILFGKLNFEFFGGILITPKFEYKFVKRYLGQFSLAGTPTISISSAWKMSDFDIECVLIHEMVHVWQWCSGNRLCHGASFKNKAKEINLKTNYKYNIARCTKISESCCLKKGYKRHTSGKRNVIITYSHKNNPDEILVAKLCDSSVEKILNWLPKNATIDNVKKYYGYGTVFDNMMSSRKNVHGYPYRKEKFEQYIKPYLKTA